MIFEQEINEMERLQFEEDFIICLGSVPIIFTAPHTMKQINKNGVVKSPEPYTKAIAMYLNKHCNTSYMIKTKDNGFDSNRDNNDEFKTKLIDFIKTNDIKLVMDLHGAGKQRDFDIEFGTLNNLTASFSTIEKLEKIFIEKGITNLKHNEPFKGGSITQYVFNLTDAEAIQLEINYKYRDSDNLDKLQKLCECLSEFVKQYKENLI